MAQKTIFTIGFDLPTEHFQYKSFNSNASLLDADIILFEPTMTYDLNPRLSQYDGKPYLSKKSSVETKSAIKHWNEEITTAYEHGKTVIIFLKEPKNVFVHNGTSLVKGKSIENINEINSFSMLPFIFKNQKIAYGKNIKFTQDGNILKSYWNIVKDISEYKLYFEIENAKPLLQTKAGDKTIGSLVKNKNGGTLLLLPPLTLPNSFTKTGDDGIQEFWTEKAIKFSKSLLGQIISIDKTLKSSNEQTPPPEWLSEEQFQLDAELGFLNDIIKLEDQILKIKIKIDSKKEILQKSQLPKKLLYENGKSLEEAIIDALETIGFKAENYDDGESEFDIVFESKEGRFIGEAEGKDNSAININKLQQLERNIQEDFCKEHVNDFAKGVLFGNPQRLTHPQNRNDFFTTKALSAAKRTGIALVNTHELFSVVKYMKMSKNKAYAKQVRECFKKVHGEVVIFPKIPVL